MNEETSHPVMITAEFAARVRQYTHEEMMHMCEALQDALEVGPVYEDHDQDFEMMAGETDDVFFTVIMLQELGRRQGRDARGVYNITRNSPRAGAILGELEQRQALLGQSLLHLHSKKIEHHGFLDTLADGFSVPSLHTRLEKIQEQDIEDDEDTSGRIKYLSREYVMVTANSVAQSPLVCRFPLDLLVDPADPSASKKLSALAQAIAADQPTNLPAPDRVPATKHPLIYPYLSKTPTRTLETDATPSLSASTKTIVEPLVEQPKEETPEQQLVREIKDAQQQIAQQLKERFPDVNVLNTTRANLRDLVRKLMGHVKHIGDIEWPGDGVDDGRERFAQPIIFKGLGIRFDIRDACMKDGRFDRGLYTKEQAFYAARISALRIEQAHAQAEAARPPRRGYDD